MTIAGGCGKWETSNYTSEPPDNPLEPIRTRASTASPGNPAERYDRREDPS